MNKTLSKEIMKRSNLRNKYLKSRSEEDGKRSAKQINLCVYLLLFNFRGCSKLTSTIKGGKEEGGKSGS